MKPLCAKNFAKTMIAGAAVHVLTSCSTTGPSFQKAEVLERIGNKTETPEWASGEKTTYVEGGDCIFISQISMAGNARSESCMKAAELDAQAGILKHIKTSITASGQVNEADATTDPGYESLTTFFAAGKLNGIKTMERYWEKRVESTETGDRALKLRCTVKVAIRKSDLEKQLREAMGGPKINTAAHEALEKATIKAIDGFGDEAAKP